MRLLWILWFACTTPTPEGPDPAVVAARAALDDALAHEPAAPTGPAGEALRVAAENALAVPRGDPDLDLALGDALSNRLLRPDLGVPLLEAAHAEARAPDAWLDALLRLGDGPRFRAAYLHRFPDAAPIDPTHATFLTYLQKAATFPDVHWAEAVEAVAVSVLVEDALANVRRSADRPVADFALGVDTLLALVDPAPTRIALARTGVPADPEPVLDRRALRAADNRKVVAVHTHGTGFADLHPFAAEAAAALSPRANTLCLEAAIDGKRQMFGIEFTIRNMQPWAFQTNDPARFTIWVEAMDAWAEARARGEADDVIRPRITETYGARFRAAPPTPPSPVSGG